MICDQTKKHVLKRQFILKYLNLQTKNIAKLVQSRMYINWTKHTVCATLLLIFLQISLINKAVVQTHVVTAEIHVKVTDGSHETYNFHYKTYHSDIIFEIWKFLFFDCDVCQIIHLAVCLYYHFIFTLTVWRIKTQGLNTSPHWEGILRQMCNR